MNEVFYMIWSFMAGLLLGILFFWGLWFTVRKIVHARMAALWVLGSFVLRVGITVAGFYWVSWGNWQRLVICVLGFMAARYVVVHFTRQKGEVRIQLKMEEGHET